MRGLKALVIVMGVLIVAGLAVVVATIASRSSGGGGDTAGFGVARIAIPPGATVVGTTATGQRLVVRLRLADGTARLVVIDPATGQRLGTIDLAPEQR